MKGEKREDEEAKSRKKAEKERFLKRIFGEDKKSIALVAGVFFVIGFLISTLFGFSGPSATGMVIGKEDIGARVVDYLNNNLVPPGSSVSLVSVEEENGLYIVTTSYQGNEIPVYVTKDGVLLLIGTVYDMTQEIEQPEQPEEPEGPPTVNSCDETPKQDKARLEVWVESMCPFGTQALNGLSYVAELFGDKTDIFVGYMVSVLQDGSVRAMHGEEELLEDKRHVCLREEQPEKFWDYIRCYVETGDPEGCEKTAGVDSDKLSTCVEEKAEEYLLADGTAWATIYRPAGGSGSPSFFINGVKVNEYSFSQNGRSPENLKNILCCGMTTKLSECDETLSDANPPRGFGEIGEGSSGSGGSC